MQNLLVKIHRLHIQSIPSQRTRRRRRSPPPSPPSGTRAPRRSSLLRRRNRLFRLKRTLIRLQQNLPPFSLPSGRVVDVSVINHEIVVVGAGEGVFPVSGEGAFEFIEYAV